MYVTQTHLLLIYFELKQQIQAYEVKSECSRMLQMLEICGLLHHKRGLLAHLIKICSSSSLLSLS